MSHRRFARLTKPLRARIRQGHPWIYDRAIELPRDAEVGEIVDVIDDEGPVAVAYCDPKSPIRARVLADDGAVEGAWTRARCAEAAARRARDPLLASCTGRRLIHGEGDRCPGLVVDQYADVGVVVFDGPAAQAFWTPRLADVVAGLATGGAPLAHVWVRGERGNRREGGRSFLGDAPAIVEIAEDDARFIVDVRAGQKTGFFLDQRDNRRTIGRHAAGLEVLNLYCYTGGFSIHAALGGATRVTSVDIAAPAMAALAENLERSRLDPAQHDLVTADAFAYLASPAAARRWDLVICDPPSFVPNEKSRQSGLPAYRRLFQACLAAVRPGGRLAYASCSSHVTEADLVDIAALSGPSLRLRGIAGSASDHPVVPAFPEGRYLKFLFFDVG
ncbi:MAG: class I SAM-dependent rRNA methyltransferase [Proteobacteria bacterium]|nr:class I SAM-dependent rRNA methyltransferase [Pseudomonadota bacterium]